MSDRSYGAALARSDEPSAPEGGVLLRGAGAEPIPFVLGCGACCCGGGPEPVLRGNLD